LIGLLAALGTAIGVMVAVFGLPYGRMNYTAFAGLYHQGGTPAIFGHYAIDCDTGSVGVQDSCTIFNTQPTIDVDVVFEDNSAGGTIGAFAIKVRNPNDPVLNAPPVADVTGFNGNPDFNEAGPGASGTWNCSLIPHDNDDGSGGAGTQTSTLDCFVQAGLGPAYAAGDEVAVAAVDYNVLANGVVTLTHVGGVLGDNGGAELLNCNGPDGLPGPGDVDMDTIDDSVDNGQCFPATITVEDPPPATATNTPPPTNTPTETPTATNTPLGGTMNKIPETCLDPLDENCDITIPAANLWICVVGPCAGPGEGNLIVFEYATNVLTGDFDSNTVIDGLGAYEFQVEYDNFVIQSVNPSDVVFQPLGSVNPYPTGADAVVDGEGAARTPPNCSFSLIQENRVRFGCVTAAWPLARRATWTSLA
jgi:hypothetical protein